MRSDSHFLQCLKKHQLAHNVQHKITSERLTVRHGMFQNAIRSDIATRDQTAHLRDDARALLNEDLFQLLAVADRDTSGTKRLKQNNTKTSRVLCDFDSTNQRLIAEASPAEQNIHKSLFRDIEEQYSRSIAASNNNNNNNADIDSENNCDQLDKHNDSFLVEDEVLNQLVYKYVNAPITNPIDKYYNDKLAKLCTKDPAKALVESLLKQLNDEEPADDDIQVPWPEGTMEPHSPLDTPPGATVYRQPAEDDVHGEVPMEVERCCTPENRPVTFPEASYHTPENQKYTLRHVESTSTSCKYEPGIYVVPSDYRSAIRDDHILQDQRNVEFNGNAAANSQPRLYHMDTMQHLDVETRAQLPIDFGISRLEKRPNAELYNVRCGGNMFERPSKQFKFDFPLANTADNDLVQDEHSLVYNRPKKLFTTKNKYTSPADSEEFYPRQPESRRKLSYSYSSQPTVEVYADPVPLVHQDAPFATFQGFRKPKYSPRDHHRSKYPENRGRVPFQCRFSPNELHLRKKYAPQTLRIDEMDENTPPRAPYYMHLDGIPKSRPTPDIQFKPRFH
ncbi:hypothetical protein CBL_02106 [Carabus blaptoides fortunei]